VLKGRVWDVTDRTSASAICVIDNFRITGRIGGQYRQCRPGAVRRALSALAHVAICYICVPVPPKYPTYSGETHPKRGLTVTYLVGYNMLDIHRPGTAVDLPSPNAVKGQVPRLRKLSRYSLIRMCKE
jgi:hypothetical protein